MQKLNIYGQELGQSPGTNKRLMLYAGDKENVRLLNTKEKPL